MTDFDLDRLGEMWRKAPDPAEMEKLRQTAEAVGRRARRAQRTEAALALVVSAAMLALALANPKLSTLLIAAAAIALMLGSSLRQRKLRALETKELTGTAEQMLDQAIARVRATLKRVRAGLFVAVPGVIIGVAFGTALRNGPDGNIVGRIIDRLSGDPMAAAQLAAVLLALHVYVFVVMRRSRQELKRLTTLLKAYRHEAETTSPSDDNHVRN